VNSFHQCLDEKHAAPECKNDQAFKIDDLMQPFLPAAATSNFRRTYRMYIQF